MNEKVICKKSVKFNKSNNQQSLVFKKGKEYEFTCMNTYIRIYFDNHRSIVITSPKKFDKYFK